MPERSATIEDLLARSRSGDQGALAELLAHERARLAAAAKQVAARDGKPFDDGLRTLERVEQEARGQFSSFTGASGQEWSAWLDDLLRRHANGAAPNGPADTAAERADATLAHPPAS